MEIALLADQIEKLADQKVVDSKTQICGKPKTAWRIFEAPKVWHTEKKKLYSGIRHHHLLFKINHQKFSVNHTYTV